MFKTFGNRLQALCNRLHAFKIKFKIVKNISETTLAIFKKIVNQLPESKYHVFEILKKTFWKMSFGQTFCIIK